MDINKVKKAEYNPRTMSNAAKDGLRASIEDFGDISGIVINRRTGNILAGNHRFDEIAKKHGRGNLVLNKLDGEWYSLDTLEDTTGFKVRVVDWEIEKEKLANVVANNDLITGEYTTDLQPLLKSIQVKVPKIKMDSLRISHLVIDDSLGDLDDIDLDNEYETHDIVKEASERKSRERPKREDNTEPSNVNDIVSNIKIIAPSELIDEINFDILESLSDKEYYNKINIIKS